MEDAINLLIATIDEFLKTGLDAIDWETKPSPEKWSKKEILGHLADSAQINLERFVRCTYEEKFKLIYWQNEWVAAKQYQQTDIKEILDLWLLINRQIIRVLTNYPPDRLQAKCDNSRDSVQLNTVEFIAADYVRHMQHHLGQVTQ
jgi:hypothetical protein